MAQIHGHSFRVESRLAPIGTKRLKNTPYLGVELELEFAARLDDDAKKELTDRSLVLLGVDFALCKHDGSLDDGVEIVSCPATFPVQVERWTRFLEGIAGAGYVARKSCGMHVHVTRNMSDSVIGKMLYFLYHRPNYSPIDQSVNCAWLCALAGRSCNDFAEIDAIDLSDLETDPSEWDWLPDAMIDDRYAALNVTKSSTIEFRFFASSLAVDRFMRRLEFVSAFVRWARRLGANSRDWTREAFCEFVLGGEKRYPYLCEWIKTRKRFVKHEDGWCENSDPDYN